MSQHPQLRICLWSGPRNVSTALMYAFTQRADTIAFDEPLYGHYLRVSGADHPSADEIMAAMDCDAQTITSTVILGRHKKPVLFLKSMTHHLVKMDWDFMAHTANVLLIRDPIEMLPSLAQVLDQPKLRDTGFKKQVDLHAYLKGLGQNPPILDARELLLNPEGVLAQLCEQLDIAFEQDMLHWPAGPKYADGVWAPYWYANVHKSTGFQRYAPKTDPFPDVLQPLLTECQPYYNQLHKLAIKAG